MIVTRRWRPERDYVSVGPYIACHEDVERPPRTFGTDSLAEALWWMWSTVHSAAYSSIVDARGVAVTFVWHRPDEPAAPPWSVFFHTDEAQQALTGLLPACAEQIEQLDLMVIEAEVLRTFKGRPS